MKNKLRRAKALLPFFLSSLFCFVSSVDFPDHLGPGKIQTNQDGRHFSSNSKTNSNREFENNHQVKQTSSFADFDDIGNPDVNDNVEECKLSDETRTQMAILGTSDWIINETTIHLLKDDIQELIQCTNPKDRIIFSLKRVVIPTRTMNITHELDLVGLPPNLDDEHKDKAEMVSFTCPESGPLLAINAINVTVSGIKVQNCTSSSGNAVVTIESKSVATFYHAVFKDNDNRAVYVHSDASMGVLYLSERVHLAIFSSIFKNNSAYDGGAIYFESFSIGFIDSSHLENNTAEYGGAVYLSNDSELHMTNCSFSNNSANSLGGAIYVRDRVTLTITKSVLSNNKVKRGGGVMRLYRDNHLHLTSSTLSNNSAEYGGVIYAYMNNNISIINVVLSNNRARSNGGVLSAEGPSNHANIVNSLFSYNEAKDGGALYLDSTSQTSLASVTFKGNGGQRGAAFFIGNRASATISKCSFLSNNASQNGCIYADEDTTLTITESSFMMNKAQYGGCIYEYMSPLNISNSTFSNNFASKSGGCFYLYASKANFQGNTLSSNHASEDGGAIHVHKNTSLNLRRTNIILNEANNSGGAIALFNSSLYCEECKFQSNSATRGSGCYIETSATLKGFVQIQKSTFEGNNASYYGGGLVIKVFESENHSRNDDEHGRVILLGTSFVNNHAVQYGAVFVVTEFDNIWVACMEPTKVQDELVISKQTLQHWKENGTLGTINSTWCPSWKGNRVLINAHGGRIGKFAQNLSMAILNPPHRQQSGSDVKYDLVVAKGTLVPTILIKTIDTFGYSPAPVLYDNSSITLSSEDGFVRQPTDFNFKNGVCIVDGITSFVELGVYTLNFEVSYKNLGKPWNLSIMVRDCSVNEYLSRLGRSCLECDTASYNFNISTECSRCPEGADCTGRYIIPEDEYWHKSPCHNKVQKCIFGEACKYQDRALNITHFTLYLPNCSLTNTNIETYEGLQCNEFSRVMKVVCVEVATSLMVSHQVPNALNVDILYFQLQASLHVPPRQRAPEDNTAPSIEVVPSTTTDLGTSNQGVQSTENVNGSSQSVSNQNPAPTGNATSTQQDIEVENARHMMIEAYKILLNFFQLTCTAATMNVKWTDRITQLFECMQVVGAATVKAISRPIDCLIDTTSHGIRSIWRLLFSIFVPLIVISIIGSFWIYRCLVFHKGEELKFLSKRLLITFVTITYMTYFDLTQLAVRVFNCVTVHNDIDPFSNSVRRYWIADTNVECYQGSHFVLIGIALLVLILISICFPLICSIALYYNRDEHEHEHSNIWTQEALGILTGPFKEKYVYWECVTMLKKALLSITIVFSYSLGNRSQGLLMILVFIFFLYLHLVCFPFAVEYDRLNYYEATSLTLSSVVYTIVQFFNIERISQSTRTSLSIILLGIIIVYTSIMVFIIIRNAIRFQRAILIYKRVLSADDRVSSFEIMRLFVSRRRVVTTNPSP